MDRQSFQESSSVQPDFLSLSNSRGKEDQYASSSLEPVVTSLSRKNRLLSGESTAKCTPWRTRDYSCDPPGLHEEINDFYDYMKPRPSEVRMRMDVISRIRKIVHSRWPLASVEVFGSYVTGLFLPTSDIDLVVLGEWPRPPLFSLEEELEAHDIDIDGTLLVLDNATVPIIKFIDKVTEMKVDIGFNHESEFKGADVICHFIKLYPILPKLVLVLKQFLTQRNLHEVFYGGISSYSLVLLVVSFLQLHPRKDATNPSANLGVLLMEFFEHYGRHFNYMRTGILLENGGSYIAKEDVSQDFLYIRDPADPSRDLKDPKSNAARGCYGMWQVKQSFEHAFLKLNSAILSKDNPVPRKETLLGSIIKISKEVDDYRKWTDSKWPTHPLSPRHLAVPSYLTTSTRVPSHPSPHHFPSQYL